MNKPAQKFVHVRFANGVLLLNYIPTYCMRLSDWRKARRMHESWFDTGFIRTRTALGASPSTLYSRVKVKRLSSSYEVQRRVAVRLFDGSLCTQHRCLETSVSEVPCSHCRICRLVQAMKSKWIITGGKTERNQWDEERRKKESGKKERKTLNARINER